MNDLVDFGYVTLEEFKDNNEEKLDKLLIKGFKRMMNSYESNISFGILNIKNLKNIDELFITKTSCGIVPIIKVNNINIGNSIPGEKTLELIQLYDNWSKQNK